MIIVGVEVLCKEFDQFKKVDCLCIFVVIVEVCEYGDFKENVEYYVVCEQQGFCEGWIQDIESKLFNVQIIDIISIQNIGKVIFGVIVIIVDVDFEEEKIYQIVGDDEVDIKSGKLSVNLFIVCGLIGWEEGDMVQIDIFGGIKEYEVDKVEYL